jgi:hypothetical protein
MYGWEDVQLVCSRRAGEHAWPKRREWKVERVESRQSAGRANCRVERRGWKLEGSCYSTVRGRMRVSHPLWVRTCERIQACWRTGWEVGLFPGWVAAVQQAARETISRSQRLHDVKCCCVDRDACACDGSDAMQQGSNSAVRLCKVGSDICTTARATCRPCGGGVAAMSRVTVYNYNYHYDYGYDYYPRGCRPDMTLGLHAGPIVSAAAAAAASDEDRPQQSFCCDNGTCVRSVLCRCPCLARSWLPGHDALLVPRVCVRSADRFT